MDKHFPGLKERYIKEFGNRYELTSCNNKNLMNYFYSVCKENKIMCDVNECFSYLHEFPREESKQLELF
ncbi:MAG: hypothetical protein J6B32_03435 [Spirochaetaceae bacterium]|nr:hypothetical protein [Spirochaetaceae bacterium]